MRQHTSAYVSIRRHTSAYDGIRLHASCGWRWLISGRICQHTSAYVSIRQHTSAYVSIRQHTMAEIWSPYSLHASTCQYLYFCTSKASKLSTW
jgi:hypothetical protein